MSKVLVRLTGLILVVVSILLIVKLMVIKYEEDLLIFASEVMIIAISIISALFGIIFLVSKVTEDDNKK